MTDKTRNLNRNNPIIKFLTSYLTVLILPLAILLIGTFLVLRVVRSYIIDINVNLMEYNVDRIDDELSTIESLALQTSRNESLLEVAVTDEINSRNILLYSELINEVYSTLQYQSVDILDLVYIYFNNSNHIIYENTLYKENIFSKYVTSWGMDDQIWKEELVSDISLKPTYVSVEENRLNYIMPVSVEGETNDCVIVYMLSTSGILEHFTFAQEWGQYAVYIFDEDNQILLKNDYLEDRNAYMDKSNIKEMFLDEEEGNIISTVSSKTGWTYVLVLSDNIIINGLSNMRNVTAGLFFFFLVGGVLAAVVMAFRMGQPINNIYRNFDGGGDETIEYENLGEAVGNIVQTNRRYQEELEKEKPQMRRAFIRDLLSAEYVSAAELKYMAESLQMELENNSFCVVSIRIFSNNDFYDVDHQTLQDANVINQAIIQHMEEFGLDQIWFYKRNYLSLLVVVGNVRDMEKIRYMAEQTYHWPLSCFAAESHWGISGKCEHAINLWKSGEEADTARLQCGQRRHIVEYDEEQEDMHSFYFPKTAEKKLYNGLKSGDREAVENLLDILEYENFKRRALSRNSFLKLHNGITAVIAQIDSTEEIREYILLLNQIIVGSEHFSKNDYLARLRDVCFQICDLTLEGKQTQRGMTVQSIQEYIQENYMDSTLGLSAASTEFGISEGYISSMFKEITGVNFAQYVEGIRMEKACQLLKDSKFSVDEIAGMVGYNSVQSFHRAFKRVYGVSPKEYR